LKFEVLGSSMKNLSIIVPVYNSDKYLSKCLDSLLAQDIPSDEYEIIIINDGSTDGSLTIAEYYSNHYPNIKIISQDNKNVGGARNTGIRESAGKYLFFVDSDDYIRPDCLGNLLDCMETKSLDLLRFNYESVNVKGEIIPKCNNSTHSIVYSENVVDGESFLTDYLGWACYPWLFIFNASFIKNNNFYFIENIYYEDTKWLVQVLLEVKRVQSINKQVYFYMQHSGSITQSAHFEKKNKTITDKLQIVDFLKQVLQTTNNKKVKLWCEGMISLTFMGILAYVENEVHDRKKEVIQLLYYQRFLPLKSYQFTVKQKRDLCLINISPLLYCFLKRRN
jgi:glycosyltransferase involved in cell wall biosynthesis